MREWLKLSQHEHTGRVRPHEHTSYIPLTVLVLIVGFVLISFSVKALAADPPPQSGSVGLSGIVPKAPPTTGATITSPSNGRHFGTSPIDVFGTCPANTLVELYKDNIFAGSGPCSSGGSFSVSIDLLYGQNSLIARVYDVLNQAGPDSSPVSVFYDARPPQAAGLSTLNFSGTQMLLNTNAVYRGTFPGELLNVPLSIVGGIPPYAINVQWGDNGNSVISRKDNLTFNAGHVYKKAGTYQITVQASDNQGQVAFLTVAAIINGQPQIANAASVKKTPVNRLLMVWPVYTTSVTVVASFWLGERREKHILNSMPLHT